jgi:hypothetical protein
MHGYQSPADGMLSYMLESCLFISEYHICLVNNNKNSQREFCTTA